MMMQAGRGPHLGAGSIAGQLVKTTKVHSSRNGNRGKQLDKS
jgi:hypothetical protein